MGSSLMTSSSKSLVISLLNKTENSVEGTLAESREPETLEAVADPSLSSFFLVL